MKTNNYEIRMSETVNKSDIKNALDSDWPAVLANRKTAHALGPLHTGTINCVVTCNLKIKTLGPAFFYSCF